MNARLRWSAVFSFLLLLFMALPAAAADGDETVSPLGWTFRWIHFAIVFGLIAYVLVKKAPAYFAGRAERIASAIDEAARERAAAEQRKREAAGKVGGLEQELADLRAAARRDGAAEAECLRAGAREEVAKVERAAQAEIAAAARAARSELKAVAAHLAVARAQGQLEKQLTPANESAIFRSFVGQLAAGGAPGSRN